ncbi:MAG: DsbA family oxidoreductase [Rhodobacteraceae bacterium]|nr:DsbA family oxidoreductase [Paracoccaceae bacterium]
MTQKEPLVIDVISDVVCPFCYLGKRRLDKALAEVTDLDVVVRWHPYQLDETLPKEGKDRAKYLSDKFGSVEAVDPMHQRIEAEGRDLGINYKFDKIANSPNTLDMHRLILWSRADDLQSETVERLFQLYFEEGADLTKPEALVNVAKEVGMEHDLVEQLLETDSDLEKTQKQVAQAREMGVTGVPFFIIDGRFAISGAEKPETLVSAIRHADETSTTEPEYTMMQ